MLYCFLGWVGSPRGDVASFDFGGQIYGGTRCFGHEVLVSTSGTSTATTEGMRVCSRVPLHDPTLNGDWTAAAFFFPIRCPGEGRKTAGRG